MKKEKTNRQVIKLSKGKLCPYWYTRNEGLIILKQICRTGNYKRKVERDK